MSARWGQPRRPAGTGWSLARWWRWLEQTFPDRLIPRG